MSAMPTSASTAPSNSEAKKVLIAGFAFTQIQLGIIVAVLVGVYCYHQKLGPFAHH